MQLNVALLGGGSWGTTVASLVARNTPVTLWARNRATCDEINQFKTNSRYLADAKLSDNIIATDDIAAAVANANVLIMAIPSQHFRAVLNEVKAHIKPWVPVISLTKGLELETHMRMTQVINDVLPGHPVGVLTGPNLAREIIAGQAAASVIAMEDHNICKEMQKLFGVGLFRVYTNTDVIGCELGGLLKNIIAVAVGIGDGLGAGDNTRAALITRGLAEISRLGVALGGKARTFSGLTGMGDMIATCTSPQSRNHHVGVELGKGRKINDIIDEMHMVAEGVKSVPAVIALAKQHGLEMPICEEIYRIVSGKADAKRTYRGLLRISAGDESEPG